MRIFRKSLAVFLAMFLLLGILPLSALAENENGHVTVTIGNDSYSEGNFTGTLLEDVSVPIESGDTVLTVIDKALRKEFNETDDYESDMTGGFISSIAGLENDNISWQYGWMGAVNGVFPSVGFGSIYVKDGDVINIQYLDYYADNSGIGVWGSLNSETDGFSFSAGRLSSVADEWGSFLMTLTVPQGTSEIQVEAVPGDETDVTIYVNEGSDEYELNENIPISDGDVLRIFVDGYETIYEINIRWLGKDSLDLILANMAEKRIYSTNSWEVISMSAYMLYSEGQNTLSELDKQSYINFAINEISKPDVKDTDYAKAIIALQSLGINPGELYTTNSTKQFSSFEQLKSLVGSKRDSLAKPESAPSVLNAFRQDPSINFDTQREAIINFLLDAQEEDGSWISGFGIDVDTPAMIITALAPYYNSNESVQLAIDRAFVWIKDQQDLVTGAFGMPWKEGDPPDYNSSSTAMVVIALCAMGYDPDGTDIFDYSALGGLLSFVNDDMDDLEPWGDYELQGFRAFVATAQFYKTGGAFDIYDFSGVETQPGRATGEHKVVPPGNPTSETYINVSFTLKGLDGKTWVTKRTVSMESDATVYHLFTKVLDGIAGISYDYASNGYIRSITNSSYGKLEEFQHGVNSGWVYSVNGDLPTIGMTSKTLNSDDDVIWYYTGDYKKEPGASSFDNGQTTESGSGAKGDDAPEVFISEGVEVGAKVDDDNRVIAEVDAKEVTDALNSAVESLKEAEKDGADASAEIKITIIPENSEITVTAVELSIPAEVIKAIAKEENIILTVESGIGSVTIDHNTLLGLTGGSGGDLTVTIEKVDPDTLTDAQKAIVGDNPVFDLSVSVGSNIVHNFDGTVTVFLPFETDNADSLTVYYLAEDGKATEMEGVKYDAKRKGFVFTTKHFSLFLIAEATSDTAELPFTDVSATDWFYNAVKYAFENALMNGISATEFAPDNQLTRAMLVTILYRYEGEPKTTGGLGFTDVSTNEWFTDAIAWASANGIVNGYGDGIFGTNDNITREQLATMLYNYATFKKLDVSKTTDLENFSDRSEISSWALPAMQWANAEGLVNGRTAETLVPEGTATRAEAATLLMRFIEEFVKK